jgi:hypothetical protein
MKYLPLALDIKQPSINHKIVILLKEINTHYPYLGWNIVITRYPKVRFEN